MDTQRRALEAVELRPSSGGVFEVSADEQRLFSKRACGRFPEEGEVERLVAAALRGSGDQASARVSGG